MITTKQHMKQARYPAPEECHRVIQATLAGLKAPAGKRMVHKGRRYAMVACAAVLVACIALASIPIVRARVEGLALNAFSMLTGPQSDVALVPKITTGLAAASRPPAATASAYLRHDAPKPDSVFAKFYDDRHTQFNAVSWQAVKVNSSQTVEGITASIVEAAIMDNRIFLVFQFKNLPKYCFPEEDVINVSVNNKQNIYGSLRTGNDDMFTCESKLSIDQMTLPAKFDVIVTTNIMQYPDGGTGDGKKVADFKLAFQMERPSVFISLPEYDQIDAKDQNNQSTDKPSVTSAAARDDSPAVDKNLIEPKNVKEWVTTTNTATGLTMEYPKGWKADKSTGWLPQYLIGKSAVLKGYKGADASIYLCAAQLDTEDLTAGADRIANIWDFAGGNTYTVSNNPVYFIWNENENISQSCILILPAKSLTINGKSYNFLLVWAPKDYNTHVLKTMKFK